jgi:ribosomal protein S25
MAPAAAGKAKAKKKWSKGKGKKIMRASGEVYFDSE